MVGVIVWCKYFYGFSDFQEEKNFKRFLTPYGQLHSEARGRRAIPQANSLILPEACQDSEMSETRWLERVGHGPACAHGDTACFRILTESGIMLWRHRLLNTIASKFIDESCACNLRSETWRRWLSACLRTHLMCAPSPGCGWKI